MLNVYPDYYPRFKCTAGACLHTCCYGWEIDIDDQTLNKYHRIDGFMGERLKDCICEDGGAHFILRPDERCPFLNQNNLCDLIIYGGDDMLCQICTDHPRFRSFLPGRIEIGLGLCCEAAAKLILTQKDKTELIVFGDDETNDEYAKSLLSLRNELFDIVQNRNENIITREERLLLRCSTSLPRHTYQEWADIFLSLEIMDSCWSGKLSELKSYNKDVNIEQFSAYMRGRETEYEKLLYYFLYRYIPQSYDDGDITGKVAFAVLSRRIIFILGALQYEKTNSFTTEDQVELVRLYSTEIEYSQENIDNLFDILT